MIRVLLAEDQGMRRGALALVRLQPDIDVVAEVGSGTDVTPTTRETQPDGALHIEIPGAIGPEAAARLRRGLPAARY